MKKKTVYVAGYEGNNKLATSGWLWFNGKQDRDDYFNEIQKDLEPLGALVYQGQLEVTDQSDELVNEEVEKFLEENDWENAFSVPVV